MNAQTRIQRGETLSLALEMVSGDLTGATCAMFLKKAINGNPPPEDAEVLIPLSVVYVENLVSGETAPGWIGTAYDTDALEPAMYVVDARIVFGERIIQSDVVRVTVQPRVTNGVVTPPEITGSNVAMASGRSPDEAIVLRWRLHSTAANPVAAVIAPPSSSVADRITFNDTLTMLGVDNVQDAIVALYALLGSGPLPSPGGSLDFSNPTNSALIGAL